MIRINLLKDRLARFQTRVLFRRLLVLYFIILGCIGFIIAIIYAGNKVRIAVELRRMEQMEKDILANVQMVSRLKTAQTLSTTLGARLTDARKEFEKRILWARKLDRIAASIPASACLTAVERKAEGRGASAVESVLVVKGYVPVNPDEDRETIVQFLNAIRAHAGSEFDSVTLTKVTEQSGPGKESVRSFVIECRIKQQAQQQERQ